MSTITVKVLHKETGIGLHELSVVLFDIDNFNEPTSSARSTGNTIDILKLYQTGIRLGSSITDSEGKVIFDTNGKDLNTNNHNINIITLILTAEEPGLNLSDRVLYSSLGNRIKSGSKEEYVIKLNTTLLKSKGLSVPKANAAADDEITKLEKQLKSNKDYLIKKKELFKDEIAAHEEEHIKKREKEYTQPLLEKISKVSKSFREGKQFVKPGQSVAQVSFQNIDGNINPVNPVEGSTKKVKGFIYLSAEEVQRFESHLDPTGKYYDVPQDLIKSEILPKLFNTSENGSSNDFIMDHPAARKCRSSKTETANTTTPDGGDIENGASNEILTTSSEQIPHYVAVQMENATSPEQQLAAGLPLVSFEKTAKMEDISKNINTIFEKGPADVPAYYEFHSLKIAFENIWQEAIDAGLISNAEQWYDAVLGNGGNPTNIVQETGTLATLNISPEQFASAQTDEPLVGVVLEFPEALTIWKQLTIVERKVLNNLSKILLSKYKEAPGNKDLEDSLNGQLPENIFYLDKAHLVTNDAMAVITDLRQRGQRIVEAAKERIDENQELTDEWSSLKRANQLKDELNNLLKTNYSFKYYAANATERSVNFGILLTYQQKWNPKNYQVGEMVKSMAFAPKETRKWSMETTVKKRRMQKEQEENLRITKSESTDSARSETEIINKASNKTTFGANTSFTGGVDIGPIKGENTSGFTLNNDAGRDSQQTKKEFREAVLKASQEYKSERKIEISTEETTESKYTESGEITNPNDELTVTYLFYELQRIFEISECLYRLRPVILVAQEMPAPHEIDNDWVITHDWILKRVLLDDSFQYALNCIKSINGESYMLDTLERAVKDQRKIVKSLTQNVRYLTEEVSMQNRLLMSTIDKQTGGSSGGGLFGGIPVIGKALEIRGSAIDKVSSILGMSGDGNGENDSARVKREAITAAYERAERERRELLGRLESETGVLSSLVKDLAKERKEFIEKQTSIAQLKAHLKDNMMFYMQSIWSYEYKDQRFFRLMDTKVPQFDGTYNITIQKDAETKKTLNDFAVDKNITRHSYTLVPQIKVKEVTLKEVADLDTLLGFKGNYMIFPMNKSNILTDFMMAPYIDSEFGLTDPDNLGNWSLEDYNQFVKCLRKEMGEEFSTIEDQLKEIYNQLLLDPLRKGDTLTVPTGSLFIEALPGSHTILEKFKLIHRYIDVKKIQAEVRGQELENIRYAARILNKENEDPKIDKKIVVEGSKASTNLDLDNE